MAEPDLQTRVHSMAASLGTMVSFAEERKDYLLAARLAEVQMALIERHSTDANILPE